MCLADVRPIFTRVADATIRYQQHRRAGRVMQITILMSHVLFSCVKPVALQQCLTSYCHALKPITLQISTPIAALNMTHVINASIEELVLAQFAEEGVSTAV